MSETNELIDRARARLADLRSGRAQRVPHGDVAATIRRHIEK